MGEPTYSYQLKNRKKDDADWPNHYYLYINRVHNGTNSSRYIGQVDNTDKRVQLIMEKKATDIALKELAIVDGKYFFN